MELFSIRIQRTFQLVSTHIDLSFDNFYSMLKENYSCLNEKEMQLCCMMIAGFKTEEIAAIWMQSIFS